MTRLEQLETTVKKLYAEKNPERADWADWLFDNHVFVVADYATELAKRYKANPELSRIAGLLHDIANACTKWENPENEMISLNIGRQLMAESGFNEDEIKLIIDDAVRYHSCHNGERPTSLEGKILATADAMAHFKTDFYLFAATQFAGDMSLEKIKQWTLEKIDRDLNIKIFFEEIREEVRPDYELIKALFSR